MAKVPFQNYNLTQEVAVGGEVQFGATDVKPQQDVVSDDIKHSLPDNVVKISDF